MNANHTYLQNQVQAASPLGLIVLLYDGLLRFTNDAREALDNSAGRQDTEKAAIAIRRSLDILTELNSSLRAEVAPELCQRLSNLYAYFTEQLSLSLHERNPQKIKALIPMMEDLRNAWQEADHQQTVDDTAKLSAA